MLALKWLRNFSNWEIIANDSPEGLLQRQKGYGISSLAKALFDLKEEETIYIITLDNAEKRKHRPISITKTVYWCCLEKSENRKKTK